MTRPERIADQRRDQLAGMRTATDLAAFYATRLAAQAERITEGHRDADDNRQRLRTLALLNRAGLITHASQCGHAERFENGKRGRQRVVAQRRAFLAGFAPEPVARWITDALIGSHYSLTMFDPARHTPARPLALVFTRVNSVDTTSRVPCQISRDGVRRIFPVHRDLVDELARMWQVTVYDPWWTRSDLFRRLHDGALARLEGAAQ